MLCVVKEQQHTVGRKCVIVLQEPAGCVVFRSNIAHSNIIFSYATLSPLLSALPVCLLFLSPLYFLFSTPVSSILFLLPAVSLFYLHPSYNPPSILSPCYLPCFTSLSLLSSLPFCVLSLLFHSNIPLSIPALFCLIDSSSLVSSSLLSSSPPTPSAHGHMLLCRWVPVLAGLLLAAACCKDPDSSN